MKIEKWHKIYANRVLNLSSIKTIGFDMDHTLAVYNRQEFEKLAFGETIKKLIAKGYPEELSSLVFDPTFTIRGLYVDTINGNILKVDGHKYVKLAFHGHRRLERQERHRIYNHNFKLSTCHSIDTMFALSETQIFIEIVDYISLNPNKICKTFAEIYKDIRFLIDLSHADGSIKNVVVGNMDKYIHRDRNLGKCLNNFIQAGKKLWLITNSHWDYSNKIMTYLLDRELKEYPNWQDYFEYIIVGAAKPNFFVDKNPFYEVMTDSNLLKTHTGLLKKNKVYQGGNALSLQNLTNVKGDEILYVGDHIYGDIIRSKEEFNWRTMLVLEELDEELKRMQLNADKWLQVNELISKKEEASEELQSLRVRLESKKTNNITELQVKFEKIKQEYIKLEKSLIEVTTLYESSIHPVWGELMKVGLEKSKFAHQVESYACLYTSKVTNFRFYSAFKKFYAAADLLPHDL